MQSFLDSSWTYMILKNLIHNFRWSLPDVPDKPASLDVDEVTRESVTLSWQPPKDDGGSPILSYILERREQGRSMWVKVTSVDADNLSQCVKDLTEGKEYYFRVSAKNEVGISEPFEMPASITPKSGFGRLTRVTALGRSWLYGRLPLSLREITVHSLYCLKTRVCRCGCVGLTISVFVVVVAIGLYQWYWQLVLCFNMLCLECVCLFLLFCLLIVYWQKNVLFRREEIAWAWIYSCFVWFVHENFLKFEACFIFFRFLLLP